MAQLTARYYDADPLRTLFPIDFALGYLKRDHISVHTGPDKTPVFFTFVSDTEIQLQQPHTGVDPLVIQRVTPRSEPIHEYFAGAALQNYELDASFVQALMILEEITDGFLQPLFPDVGAPPVQTADIDLLSQFGILNMGKDMSMDGHSIKDLPSPTSATEPLRLGDIDLFSSPAGTALAADYTGDGTQDKFRIPLGGSNDPLDVDGTVDGISQPFTVIGSAIQFGTPPALGTDVQVTSVSVPAGIAGAVPISETYVGDNVETNFAIPDGGDAVPEGVRVYLDGQRSYPFDGYDILLGDVVFDTAPAEGVEILIESYNPAAVATAQPTNITVSTSAPTGVPADNQLWVQVSP